MIRKAAIYDPYLDTLGGGERYCLTVAEILLSKDYQIDLFWSGSPDLISLAEKRFNLNLKNLNLKPDIFGLTHPKIDLIEENLSNFAKSQPVVSQNVFQKFQHIFKKYQTLSQYDLVFYLSDGSVPLLFAKKNFLHVQVPFILNITLKEKLANIFKTKLIKKVLCNSNFTSKFLSDFPATKIEVLYPPVDIEKFSSSKNKDNIILSVGRFDNILNAKKQDVLIEAFEKLVHQNPKLNWKLVLMGGSHDSPEKNNYLQHLKYMAKNLPIEFVVNPPFETLKEIYSKSKIYWHAAGFGVDELLHPEETEHFGMTVVEAMDSGLVPVVVAKGGLTEIVKDSQNGFLWQNIDELIAKTQLLFSTPKDLEKMAIKAQESAKSFSKQVFEEKLLNLINQ